MAEACDRLKVNRMNETQGEEVSNSETDVTAWQSMQQNIFQHMGLKYTIEADGHYRTYAPLNDRTGNHVKTFHAAFQFALAEAIGGIVIFENRASERYVPLVKSVSMNFRKPAATDLFASAHFGPDDVAAMNQAMADSGRYDFTLEIPITDTNGERVSEMKAVYAVRLAPS